MLGRPMSQTQRVEQHMLACFMPELWIPLWFTKAVAICVLFVAKIFVSKPVLCAGKGENQFEVQSIIKKDVLASSYLWASFLFSSMSYFPRWTTLNHCFLYFSFHSPLSSYIFVINPLIFLSSLYSPVLYSTLVLSGWKELRLTKLRNVNMHKLLLSPGCSLSPPVWHHGDKRDRHSRENIVRLLFLSSCAKYGEKEVDIVENKRRENEEAGSCW